MPMKKIALALLGFCWLIVGCDDGDLQIETLDFDDTSVQSCSPLTTSTRVFFKINQDEALILQLASGLLRNEVSTDTIQSPISTSGSQLFYRVFSETVNSSYFCSLFPPVEPNVLEQISAQGGQVLITTTAVDSLEFLHNIKLQGLVLENSLGEQIIDQTVSDFGTVTTTAN